MEIYTRNERSSFDEIKVEDLTYAGVFVFVIVFVLFHPCQAKNKNQLLSKINLRPATFTIKTKQTRQIRQAAPHHTHKSNSEECYLSKNEGVPLTRPRLYTFPEILKVGF